MNYIPKRGDVVWIDFSPQVGHEHSGRRPAIVLTSLAYNRRIGLALFCPITSRIKGYPFEVPLPEGIGMSGVILADQIKSLAWRERKAVYILTLPDEMVKDLLEKIDTLLK
jgi:mRNA interferase MazF